MTTNHLSLLVLLFFLSLSSTEIVPLSTRTFELSNTTKGARNDLSLTDPAIEIEHKSLIFDSPEDCLLIYYNWETDSTWDCQYYFHCEQSKVLVRNHTGICKIFDRQKTHNIKSEWPAFRWGVSLPPDVTSALEDTCIVATTTTGVHDEAQDFCNDVCLTCHGQAGLFFLQLTESY